MGAPGFAARRAAAELLAGVLGRRTSLADQLAAPAGPLGGLAPEERARAQALATTTLRHLERVDAFLMSFLDRRPPAPALIALRLAATEMQIDGIPAHAAVDSAVRLARAHPKSRHLSGLVNAVARRAAQAAELWSNIPDAAPPGWIADAIAHTYGAETARAIAEIEHREPPVDITAKVPAEASELAARLGGETLPTGSIRLRHPGRISGLPGFDAGAWWVQDAAAALPARLLGDVCAARVLDLCAAPGGKTLQLAAAGARVTALDLSAQRLARLRENLARTQLAAEIITADALHWHPSEPPDAVLLDAPCSATGTIRRHPDLPYIRRAEDLDALLALQERLLARAWDWLRPGGRLVFCTCSLLPEEGEAQIAAFLARRADARLLRPEAEALGIEPAWLDERGALRLRPDFWAQRGGMDGFYAAVLQKL